MRRGPKTLYRRLESARFALTRDRPAILRFLAASRGHRDLAARLGLLARFERVTHNVRGYHALAEMLRVTQAILERPGAVVVEAGCGPGSSTAKLSLAVRAAGGVLHACDSFRGVPDNKEVHENLDGRTIRFRAGAFRGRLRAVERAVTAYGAPEVVRFHKGWFADTLPFVPGPFDVILCDVDLLASTRTCLVELMPRLAPGGVVFSQDGHLVAIASLLGSARFWIDEVGVEPPEVRGAGRDKLIEIRPGSAGPVIAAGDRCRGRR